MYGACMRVCEDCCNLSKPQKITGYWKQEEPTYKATNYAAIFFIGQTKLIPNQTPNIDPKYYGSG